ncbi:hypothetical protein BDY19DRAFT_387153 [Irpex rosettiformis]|uniref:Uncharacterized protein n=1 Tax=Irpex rosettiformis TaxID=378272 RepID=A0ACB8TVE9_9APHY|nr:hypothetical protein BDY19DRAFT_387153 [Irpex rosettiformis]
MSTPTQSHSGSTHRLTTVTGAEILASIKEETVQKAEELAQKNALLLKAAQELLTVRLSLTQLLEQVNSTLFKPVKNGHQSDVRSAPIRSMFMKLLKLEAHEDDIEGYMRRAEHHEEWYWYLVDSTDGCGLTHENAYAMSVAMHADAGIPFDKVTCTYTPWSP